MKKFVFITMITFNVSTIDVHATPTWWSNLLSSGSLWDWDTPNNVGQSKNNSNQPKNDPDLFEKVGHQDLNPFRKASIQYFFDEIQSKTPLTEAEKVFFLNCALYQGKGSFVDTKNLELFCECFPEVKTLEIGEQKNYGKNYQPINLPNNLDKLLSLERLVINGPFNFAPGTFKKLENLKKLILAHNEFTEFPEEVLELDNLEDLAIYTHTLRALPSTTGHLKLLKSFNMYYYGRNVIEMPRQFFLELADNPDVKEVSIALETIPYRLKNKSPLSDFLSDFDAPAYLDAVSADPEKHISHVELEALFGQKFDGNGRV